jgi:LacI family transcriptional regulator
MNTITPKKIRLSDIAKAADISISTASMALADHPRINDETKKLVLRLCKKFGYQRPSERSSFARTDKHKSVRFGFMFVGSRMDDESHIPAIHALTAHAKELNVRLEISSIAETESFAAIQQQLTDFISDLDGLIIQGIIDKALLAGIEKMNIPYVIQGSIILKPGETPSNMGHFITMDFQAMGSLAAGRLIACGHRRIGFVSEKIYPGLYNHGWLAGYRQAHYDAGLVPAPQMVHIAGERLVGGKPAARYFSTLAEPPTAYVIPDFRTGASFINEMQAYGIQIPRESIILGGVPDMAIKYHLEQYPSICGDNLLFVKVTLDTLYRLYQKPVAYSTVINIPFTTQNLPKPPTVEKS